MEGVEESAKFERRVLTMGVGYAVVVFSVFATTLPVQAAMSAPIGAGIGLLNTWLLSRGLRALMTSRALAAFGAFTFIKLALTGLILYGLFRAGWVAPLPFVTGLGAVPVALTLAQLFAGKAPRGATRSS